MKNITPKLIKIANAVKKNIRQVILIALIIVAVLIAYGNDLAILANEALTNEALNYLLLFPFFAGFLFYLKRDFVKATVTLNHSKNQPDRRYFNEIIGVSMFALSFLIYWYGSKTLYPLEFHLFSLPIFIIGIIFILLNPQALKKLIFPIVFLFFIIPLPTAFTNVVGGYLANFNTQASYTIMHTLGLPVTLTSSYGAPAILVSTAAGQIAGFAVDVSCSGIYSLTAFAMFATFLVIISSTSLVKKFLLFVIGFIVFAALNVIRLIIVVTVGYVSGEGTAMLVHSFAGLILIFTGMLLLLGFSDKILKINMKIKPEKQEPCLDCKTYSKDFQDFCQNCGRFLNKSRSSISKLSLLKIIAIISASSVLMLFTGPTFATAQNSVQISSSGGWQNASNIFPKIPGYNLTFLYEDTEYETVSGQDISLVYGYFPTDISREPIYVELGISSSLSKLHNWESCLIAWRIENGLNPSVQVISSKGIQLLQDPPLIGSYLAFINPPPNNFTQFTLYWYEKVMFETGSGYEQKYIRVSMIMLPKNPENYSLFEQELLTTGQVIASTWNTIKTHALVLSLSAPMIAILLVICSIFIVITQTAKYFNNQKQLSKNLALFRRIASAKEKIVMQTIVDLTAKKNSTTTLDILTSVEKRVRKSVNPHRIIRILNNLEEYGLIRKSLVSVGKAPLLTWKQAILRNIKKSADSNLSESD